MADVLHHSIPFSFHMGLDAANDDSNYLEKSEDSGRLFLKGVASDTLPDKQNQRFSKKFIESMVESAKGMTCFYEHNRDLDHTIGVCKDAIVENDSLNVLIELEQPESNDLVKKLVSKSQQGIRIGLSVSGVVTKSTVEKKDSASSDIKAMNENEELPIQVLEEGRLDEISAVGLPSNPRGWAAVIMKSFKDGVSKNMTDLSDVQQSDLAEPPQIVPDPLGAEESSLLKAEEEPEKPAEPQPEPAQPERQEEKITMHSEIVNGIAEAIGGSIRSLNDALTALRQSVEQKNQELSTAVLNLTEKVDFTEKSQHEKSTNALRSNSDRLESNLRTQNESSIRAAFDKQNDNIARAFDQVNSALVEITKAFDGVVERIDVLETKVDAGSDVFKQQVKEATSEAIESFQQNPSPSDAVRKSGGNQDFNNVEERQTEEPEARVFKNNDGDLVVKGGSVNPATLTKTEISALNDDQKLDALNAVVGQMMGMSGRR